MQIGDSEVQVKESDVTAADMLNMDDAAFAKLFEQGEPEAAAPAPAKEEAAPEPKVIPADGEVQETEDAAASDAGEEAKGPEAKEPEAPKPLLTKFAVFDAEGELDVPSIEIEFKANGKVRREPLDKVVLLAQQGVFNSERIAQVNKIEAEATQSKAEATQYKEAFADLERHYERLFNDEDFYLAAREKFRAEQTPEARAARAEQRLKDMEAGEAGRTEQQSVQQFVAATLIPTVEALVSENPQVTEQEVMAQFGAIIAPLMVKGKVPASRLSEVQRLVEGDLTHWVKARAIERLDTPQDKAEGKKTETKEKPKTSRELVRTKRQLARAVAPATKPTEAAPPKPVAHESAEDWFKATFPTE